MTDEKVVLVTAGSSGIGAATVSALAQAGYRVFGSVRSPDTPVPAGVERVALDVRDEASIAAGIASVLSGARSNRPAREQRRRRSAWKG